MQLEEHHKKGEVATNRPAYREARWEKAVKVYTVNQESRYLLVQNVHALGVTQELLQLFSLYGDIQEYRILDEYPCEPYTDVYWIKFVDISAARLAKRKLDDKSFFGKNIHVSYAPEFESVEETRDKLQQRRRTIAQKIKEACTKSQRDNAKAQQKQREELDSHVAKAQCSAAEVVAECSPKLQHSTEKIVPISIPIDFDEPSSLLPPPGTPSLSSQDSPHSLSSQNSHLKQTYSGALPTTSMPHPHPPLPLLPTPSRYGEHSTQYPSQMPHAIMGGALSLTTPHDKTSIISKSRQPHTKSSETERERGSKRPLSHEEKSREGKGLRHTSGLSTSQRVAAFLESKDEDINSSSSTKVFTKRGPPLKKVALQSPASSGRGDGSRVGVASAPGLSERTPVPSEGYFPVTLLPPVRTGNRSVDSSIQAVRSKMNKVWEEHVHTPNIQQPKKPKKRKRI